MNKRLAVCAVLACISVGPLRSVAIADLTDRSSGPSTYLEESLLEDASDGRLDQFALAEASIVASGVTDQAKLAAYRSRLQKLSHSLAKTVTVDTSVRSRAAKILRAMHQHILTGEYQAACTGLDRALESGDYNCVTATILYRCLCAEFDIPIITLAEPDHVYCQLAVQPPVYIQTTSSDGFAVSSDFERVKPSSARHKTGYPGRGNGLREITDVELLARIYYNRGVSLLKKGQYQQAFDLLQISHQLDPENDIARQNILACINNWALSESDAERYRQAAELLSYGLEIAPDYGPFRDNELHVHHRWVMKLCGKGEFEQALDILELGHRRRPRAALFDSGRLSVYAAWKDSLLASGKAEEAAMVLATAKQRFPKRTRTWRVDASSAVGKRSE
jgi:tetratricopeptide (TPR) repeat protein